MEWLDSVVTVVAGAVIFFYVKSLKGDIKEVKADLIKRINEVKADLNEVKTDLTKRIDEVKTDLKSHEDKCAERNEEQALTIGALIHKTSGEIPTDSRR